jgi:hypothetical protein
MKQAGPCGRFIIDVHVYQFDHVEAERDDLHRSTDRHLSLECLELGSRDDDLVISVVLERVGGWERGLRIKLREPRLSSTRLLGTQ